MGGLAKGLSVIRAFARDRPSMSLSNIAAATQMPAATARRCLLTLEELGYVTRSGRQFVLRPKMLELGAAYLESMDIEAFGRRIGEAYHHVLANECVRHAVVMAVKRYAL
jgi:IclR family pca regulon transcriptional regulator